MKKIRRVAKNEVVVVKMLDESLQDLFDKLQDSQDEFERAQESVQEDPKDENLWKAAALRNFTMHECKVKFWRAVHEKYGMWSKELGVRDGYSLVQVKRQNPPPFERLLRDLLG